MVRQTFYKGDENKTHWIKLYIAIAPTNKSLNLFNKWFRMYSQSDEGEQTLENKNKNIRCKYDNQKLYIVKVIIATVKYKYYYLKEV